MEMAYLLTFFFQMHRCPCVCRLYTYTCTDKKILWTMAFGRLLWTLSDERERVLMNPLKNRALNFRPLLVSVQRKQKVITLRLMPGQRRILFGRHGANRERKEA